MCGQYTVLKCMGVLLDAMSTPRLGEVRASTAERLATAAASAATFAVTGAGFAAAAGVLSAAAVTFNWVPSALPRPLKARGTRRAERRRALTARRLGSFGGWRGMARGSMLRGGGQVRVRSCTPSAESQSKVDMSSPVFGGPKLYVVYGHRPPIHPIMPVKRGLSSS